MYTHCHCTLHCVMVVVRMVKGDQIKQGQVLKEFLPLLCLPLFDSQTLHNLTPFHPSPTWQWLLWHFAAITVVCSAPYQAVLTFAECSWGSLLLGWTIVLFNEKPLAAATTLAQETDSSTGTLGDAQRSISRSSAGCACERVMKGKRYH